MKPWISVIIPIFNGEKFLKQCIESILCQSYTNFEVLLIDDGSTDGSEDICQFYSSKDSRIKYFKKENGGPLQTRIYGVELSIGEYITFCDCDDFYLSNNAFEILYHKTKEKNVQVVQFGYAKQYNHIKRVARNIIKEDIYSNEIINNEFPKLLCSFWEKSYLTTNCWNKIYHKSLLSALPKSGSVGRIFWGEDLILNLYLIEKCESMVFIANNLYGYRQLSGGTSRFSVNEMKDLNTIKHYQLLFLKRYKGYNTDKIENILYSEVAAWFFIYVQQCLKNLTEDQTIKIIEESLSLENFQCARNYYLQNSQEHWLAVDLLRNAKPEEYIIKAKELNRKNYLKDKFRSIIKQILANL